MCLRSMIVPVNHAAAETIDADVPAGTGVKAAVTKVSEAAGLKVTEAMVAATKANATAAPRSSIWSGLSARSLASIWSAPLAKTAASKVDAAELPRGGVAQPATPLTSSMFYGVIVDRERRR